MQWLYRTSNYGTVRHSHHAAPNAKRSVLRELGIRRSQPLNFPIPIVEDDFTKLVRLNFERLQDAGRQNLAAKVGIDSKLDQEFRGVESQSGWVSNSVGTPAKESRSPNIRHLPTIKHSSDGNGLSVPKTNSADDVKAKIDRDVDDLLQTFRDLQREIPGVALPTNHIKLWRYDTGLQSPSRGRLSCRNVLRSNHHSQKRDFATLGQLKGNLADTAFSGNTRAVKPRSQAFHRRWPGQSSNYSSSKIGIRSNLQDWADANEGETPAGLTCRRPPLHGSQYAQNIISQAGEDDVTNGHDMDNIDEEDRDQMDQMQLTGGIDDYSSDVSLSGRFYRRGDLVGALHHQGRLAIFFKNFLRHDCLLYTEDGQWMVCKRYAITFRVPRYVDPRLLGDLLPYMTNLESVESIDTTQLIKSQSPPRVFGQRAREKIAMFRNKAEAVYRLHADRIDRTYDILAPHSTERGCKICTLEEICVGLFGGGLDTQSAPELMWIIHRHVSRQECISLVRTRMVIGTMYCFIPSDHAKKLQTVQRWARHHQLSRAQFPHSPKFKHTDRSRSSEATRIERFAKKASYLVTQSRDHMRVYSRRIPSSHIPQRQLGRRSKSYSNSNFVEFDNNDQLIIDYLRSWALSSVIQHSTTLSSAGPAILRAIGAYDGMILDAETAYTFLQEIGNISNCADPRPYTMPAGLPGYSRLHPYHKLQCEAKEEAQHFKMQDSMIEFRKDWGQLAVYCIDSETTVEFDDGLSIESIPGSTDAWLHVHVANPTAFIKSTSATAHFAANMASTAYLAENRIPMLDAKLVERLSLKGGSPVITFSAKVNASGNILEETVSHGIVHNVYHLTPNQVDEACFSMKNDRQSIVFSVGKPPTQPQIPCNTDRPKRTLNEENASELRRIQDLTSRGENLADSARAVNHSYRKADRSITETRTIQHYARSFETQHADSCSVDNSLNDPFMSVLVAEPPYSLASDTVATLMILAGKIAGRWCMKRNIPAPFRGFVPNPEPAVTQDLAVKDRVNYLKAAVDVADLRARLEQLSAIGIVSWSASPVEHPFMRGAAYVQATSPLRRYGDMLLHWQIESFLTLERERGPAATTANAQNSLTFSHSMVQHACQQLAVRQHQLHELEVRNRAHWFAAAMCRSFYKGDGDIPHSFPVVLSILVNSGLKSVLKGQMLATSETVEFDCDDAHLGPGLRFQLEDIWEVEIKEISLYHAKIFVTPLRLLQRKS